MLPATDSATLLRSSFLTGAPPRNAPRLALLRGRSSLEPESAWQQFPPPKSIRTNLFWLEIQVYRRTINKFFEKIFKKVCKYKNKYYLCIRVEQVAALVHQPIGY